MRLTPPLLAIALLAATPLDAAEPASPATVAANAAVARALPFADRDDYALADRGFVATLADPVIRAADGRLLRDLRDTAFLKGDAPATANPSLWRNAQLTARHGLYKVADGLWQVRGFDLSNMTIVQGRTGWIVIDPLTTAEAAAAAMGLVRKHLGDRPIVALIYTHSHVDHFGGAGGIVAPGANVPVYAPTGFLHHAVSENVIAGPAMGRRAQYMFGQALPAGPDAHIGTGIGPRGSGGRITLVPSTHEIKATGETATIDGVAIEFQLTPGTEAPAEMNLYFSALRALCLAENANAAMHNLLTPRGALVRDAKAWADYLTESLRRYGGRSDVLVTSHHWPRWEQPKVAAMIARHRDAYKFVHDQSVRLMNRGLTGVEIGNVLQLPPALANAWYNRGHYGSLGFNARAVYQRYMGHYDGNPVNLDPLPPEDVARRTVAAIGGPERVRALAAEAHAKGDDRWAATLYGHLVFADPADAAAKAGLAATLEQLGYRAESAPWRNIYLSGAQELRGSARAETAGATAFDLARAMPLSSLLDLLAVRLDPAKAGDANLRIAFVDPVAKVREQVTVANAVLIHEAITAPEPSDATVTAPTPALLALLTGAATAPDLIAKGALRIDGDASALRRFAGLFEAPPPGFGLVVP